MIEKGRVNLSFDALLNLLESRGNFIILPLDMDLLRIAVSLKGLETHERLILAAAKMTGTPLVLKDKELQMSGEIIIWN